jgi:prolyl oligopeptidase
MADHLLCGVLLLSFCGVLLAQRPAYPPARKSDQADTYNGTKVADPYRWLEDTDSKESETWIAAEDKLTSAYLAALPGRERLKKDLTSLFNRKRYAGPFVAGGRYFIFHNDGLQNQNVLFVMDSLNGKERFLLDPNTLRADGTAALSGLAVSRDGKYLAYSISQAGSDWQEWKVRDIAAGKDLSDLVQWTKFSGAEWTNDNTGFYYMRYPEPSANGTLKAANTGAKIYLHRVGQPQSADKLIYEDAKHPDRLYSPTLSEDGRYLVLNVQDQDFGRNLLFYMESGRTTELIGKMTAAYDFLGSEGTVFYLRTTENASNGKVIALDVKHPEPANWKVIVPEQKEAIESAQYVDRKFIVSYLKDAHAQTRIYGADGKLLEELPLPGLGTIAWSGAHQTDKEMFYTFTTFTSPGTIYHFDLTTRKSTLSREPVLTFDPAAMETKQVFYASKDGTEVPMFLTYRKGLKLDGSNPTLLYGYGGFNVAMTPSFSAPWMEWVRMGGIFAVANLRGGSEYGEAWHEAGMKLKKQNVFDDFIAAGEYLITNKYTSKPKLAIFGGSNGGLLIGAVLNQRPDLFGAAIAAVGVMDMLRFDQFTIGKQWTGDYGSPSNPQEFKALRAYSPLHNIKVGTKYPPTLITTSDHDDRVFPGHSFKYAAAMQAAQEGSAPVLIRIERRAGHGAGRPVSKSIEEYSDMWAFLANALKMDFK